MAKVAKAVTNEDKLVKMPNLTEKIQSQVLVKIGTPPWLDRVEVSRLHHGGKYRVNMWQRPEPSTSIPISLSPRIRWSYYLTVSDTGEIIDSNPRLARLCSSA